MTEEVRKKKKEAEDAIREIIYDLRKELDWVDIGCEVYSEDMTMESAHKVRGVSVEISIG